MAHSFAGQRRYRSCGRQFVVAVLAAKVLCSSPSLAQRPKLDFVVVYRGATKACSSPAPRLQCALVHGYQKLAAI
jgi:hypothetical protein